MRAPSAPSGSSSSASAVFSPCSSCSSLSSYRGSPLMTAALAEPVIKDPIEFYVNVHTQEFQNGAIRGQLDDGPGPAGSLHILPSPLRAYDSREETAGKLDPFEERVVSVATGEDPDGNEAVAVPPGATAALITLTATETESPGYLVVFSADSDLPATSNVNWAAPLVHVAVGTQVAVDAGAQIKVAAGPSSADFIVDVVGYLY